MAVNNQNVLPALMSAYDSAADTVETLIDKLINKQEGGVTSIDVPTLPIDVEDAKSKYKFEQNITDYAAGLPTTATGVQIKSATDISIDLTSPYINTTVSESDLETDKNEITLGKESELVEVSVPTGGVDQLSAYNMALYSVLNNLISEINSINIDSVQFDYVERPETFYTVLYNSGFLSVLKEYNIVDNINELCNSLDIDLDGTGTAISFPEMVDGLSKSVSNFINNKLGTKGFRIPSALILVTDSYLETIKDYTKNDYSKTLDVMIEKLKEQAMSNVISISQLDEEFTKHINNAEVVLHKTLLAAKEAQFKSEIELNTASLKVQGQQIKAISNYFQFIDQAIQTYKLNLQAASSLSDAWSSWVDASISKENIGLELNQIYLDEFKGLLKERAEIDKYKKMLLESYTKQAELNSKKEISEKNIELEKNAVQQVILDAKLEFARRHLKQFEVELNAFKEEANFIYQKYKTTADLIPAYADVSVAGAKGLSSVIGDSKIKLTTYKK